MKKPIFAAGAGLIACLLAAPAFAAASQAYMVDFAYYLFATGSFIVAILALAYVIYLRSSKKKSRVSEPPPGRLIQVIPLGPKERINIIEVGESWLVTGSAPGIFTHFETLTKGGKPVVNSVNISQLVTDLTKPVSNKVGNAQLEKLGAATPAQLEQAPIPTLAASSAAAAGATVAASTLRPASSAIKPNSIGPSEPEQPPRLEPVMPTADSSAKIEPTLSLDLMGEMPDLTDGSAPSSNLFGEITPAAAPVAPKNDFRSIYKDVESAIQAASNA